jgi:hypothetical protein
VKLAIADPPYPPLFSERRDLADGTHRLTARSRAGRWYGDGPRAANDPAVADFHPDHAVWDDLEEHRKLLVHLMEEYDGWAIATTPDGLGAYHPLPVSVDILAWHRPTALPGGGRLIHRWEPVIAYIPDSRRGRGGERVSDVLTANPPRDGFTGAKPPEWTRWVLGVLGYTPGTDTLVDLFPGSGSVARTTDGMLAL